MGVTNYIWDVENDSYLMGTDENGDTLAEYTNEPGQYGPLVSQRRSEATSTFHFDGQGSTGQVTDENETVTNIATYAAFGEQIAQTGPAANLFRFGGSLGYYANPGSSDYYVRARTYSPAMTRWLSVDPIEYSGSLNRYTYVRNQPSNLVDPSGLRPPLPPTVAEIAECIECKGYVHVCVNVNVLHGNNATLNRAKELIKYANYIWHDCCIRFAASFKKWTRAETTALLDGPDPTGNPTSYYPSWAVGRLISPGFTSPPEAATGANTVKRRIKSTDCIEVYFAKLIAPTVNPGLTYSGALVVVISDFGTRSDQVLAHELGHNFGLGHTWLGVMNGINAGNYVLESQCEAARKHPLGLHIPPGLELPSNVG